MPEISKKRVITAALVGGFVFCLIVSGVDYLLGREFSWMRIAFYFPFAVVMYGFLTYRSFKKHNRK